MVIQLAIIDGAVTEKIRNALARAGEGIQNAGELIENRVQSGPERDALDWLHNAVANLHEALQHLVREAK